MPTKSQLLVIILFLFAFGCKNTGIDSSVLDDDGRVKPTSAWAMVDFFLFAPSADDNIPEGAVVLNLSMHLRQEKMKGVNVHFKATESIVFTAPDSATNEAIPDSDTALINMVGINFINSLDKLVCPENDIPVELVRNETNDKDKVIFRAIDLACGGNNKVSIDKLAGGIDTLAAVPPHVWKNADTELASELLERVEKVYEAEKKESGALQKTGDEETDKVVDNFLLKRRMLKGYVAMRKAIEKQTDLEKMSNEVFMQDDNKHFVIPSVLNAFLDVRANSKLDADYGTDDIDMMMMKEAVGVTVLRFLQFQHMFQSEDFGSSKYAKDYEKAKNKFSGSLRSHIDELEQEFRANISQQAKVYSNFSDIATPLNTRITNLNTFLKNEVTCQEYTACEKVKAAGGSCEKNKVSICEELEETFYSELTAPACVAKKEDEADNDLFILLTTNSIMVPTRIHKPCDKYDEASPLALISKNDSIKKSIELLKKRTSENLSKLGDIYKKSGNEFRQKLLEEHYFAVVPVISEHPDKAEGVAGALKTAHEKVYAKRKADESWQKAAGIIGWVAGITAGLAIATAFIPPLSGTFATVAGLGLSVSGILATISVASGAALFAIHTSEFAFFDYREMVALERAIYSGGQGNSQAQAAALREWRGAGIKMAIEGISLGIGAKPAIIFVKNPQAFRKAWLSKEGLKTYWGGVKTVGKGIRHPIETTKNLARGARDGLKNFHHYMMRKVSKGPRQMTFLDKQGRVIEDKVRYADEFIVTGDDAGRVADDVANIADDGAEQLSFLDETGNIIKTGDEVADTMRTMTRGVEDGAEEVVKNSLRTVNKASIIDELKNLSSSIGKGRYRVMPDGELSYVVPKQGLGPAKTKEIQEFFKAKHKVGKNLRLEENTVNGVYTIKLVPKNSVRSNIFAGLDSFNIEQMSKLSSKINKGQYRATNDMVSFKTDSLAPASNSDLQHIKKAFENLAAKAKAKNIPHELNETGSDGVYKFVLRYNPTVP